MKGIVCICLFAVVATALARPHEDEDKYTNKYDEIDVDEIMDNDRLRKGYLDCLLDTGKCTPEGKELKSNIHGALTTECAKCTDKQKEKTELVLSKFINQYVEEWKELCAKYDPDNKFSKKYEERLSKLKKA